MSWSDVLIIYVIGFALVQLLTWLGLRSEPTAHGKIVGSQMGCIVGLSWPFVLPYFALFGLGYALWKAWRWIRGKFR